jgi:hypothetical protein
LPEGGTSSGFPTVAFASPVAADCAGRCCPKLANAARLVKDHKYSAGLHGHANAYVDMADLLTTGGNSGHGFGYFLRLTAALASVAAAE